MANQLIGTEDSDTLAGTLGDDDIEALGGDDLIKASQGSDFVDGGDGHDELFVDMSDTSLFAAATGSRTYTITGSGIFDSSGTLNTTFSGVESIELDTRNAGNFGDTIDASGWTSSDPNFSLHLGLGAGNDTVIGSPLTDVVDTGLGINTIDTGDGWDFVFAEFDNSSGATVYVTGTGGQVNFTLNGVQVNTIVNAESVIAFGEYSDAPQTVVDASGLTGYDGLQFWDNNGTNISIGSPGNDIFRAIDGYTLGNDVLTGNGGADVYDYSSALGAINGDTITDLSSDDTIDLSHNGPGENSSGLLATTYIGAGYFSGVAGEYRDWIVDGHTELQFDTDGDGVADQVLIIANGAFALGEIAPNVLKIFGLSGTQGDDVFNGTPGDDSYYALGGNDVLNGFGGNDTLDASAGNDILNGGGGNDSLYGADGDDFLKGGFGDDLIDGGNGYDRAGYYQVDESLGGVTVDLNIVGPQNTGAQGWDTLSGIEYVSGTPFADTLTGDANDNILWGSAATIDASSNWVSTTNNDTLDGGDGNDLLVVGIGNQRLIGGNGTDTVSFTENFGDDPSIHISLALQGAAQDTGQGMWTLTGIENLSGGDDGDLLTGDANANVLAGAAGNDTLVGGGGNDQLYGDGKFGSSSPASGAPTLLTDIGANGNDTLEGGLGNDMLNGGGGVDTASYEHASGSVTVTLFNFGGGNGNSSGADGNDTLAGIENLTGSAFNDNLTGNALNNVLTGGDGHDVLRGNGGADTLYGGTGDDFLSGGFGDDVIDGGTGYDRAAFFTGATAGVHVDLNLQGVAQDTGQGMDTLINIEHASGTSFSDTLIGDGGNNWLSGQSEGSADTISGNGGDDLIVDGSGNHILDGGSGIDTFSVNTQLSSGVRISLALQGAAQDTGIGSMTLTGFENLSGSGWNDTLTGDSANNVLGGEQGNDILVGGAGDDALYGDGAFGVDTHGIGGSGPITFYSDFTTLFVGAIGGDDTLEGGLGDDVLDGGSGVDTATYAHASGAVTVNLVAGTATGADGNDSLINVENVVGSAFNDTLVGNGGGNVIDGGDGLDTLAGFGGDDTLNGGAGSDTIFGNQGNDLINGGDGNDNMRGGTGDDVIDGGAGFNLAGYFATPSDPIAAGVTVDLNLQGSAQATGQGSDTLVNIQGLAGTQFDDTLIGDNNINLLIQAGAGVGAPGGNDQLFGNGGDDLLIVGSGNVLLNGGTGTDTASFAAVGATLLNGVTVSLSLQGAAQSTGSGNMTLVGIENLSGTGLADTLTGDSGTNLLCGAGGDDTLVGGAGNDTLLGDAIFTAFNPLDGTLQTPGLFADASVFTGQVAGNDLLEGGLGNDTLDGGAGIDTASYAHASAGVTVNLATGTSSGADDNDTLVNIENLTGSAFNDTLTGNSGANTLDGGAGADTIQGGAGDDLLIGGDGADSLDGGAGMNTADYSDSSAAVTINLSSGKGSGGAATGDTLTNIQNVTGSAFNDKLTGNSSGNVLSGGSGNDQLNGGVGADTLFGGSGSDSFLFGSAAEVGSSASHDVVMDFEAGGSTAGSAVDHIDLTAIDAIARTTTRDDAFSFIGTSAFTRHAGELRVDVTGDHTANILGDTNGDGVADFVLEIHYTGTLDASDFLL